MLQSLLPVIYTIGLVIVQTEAFQIASSWPTLNRIPRAPHSPPTSSLFMVSAEQSSPSSPSTPTPTLSPSQIEKKIAQLGRSGRTDEALALYYSLDSPTLRQMNSAIDACSRARPTRLEECSSILKNGIETHSLQPNVFSFGTLMSACSRARNANRAIQVLGDMQTKYNVQPNHVIYSSAISACSRSHPPKWETALEILKTGGEKVNIVGWNAALSACARAGQWEPAIELLQQMELSGNSNNIAPDAVTYGTVLAACESGKQWDLVLKYANQSPYPLDGLSLTSVLHACQQLGMAQEALDYLEVMKSTHIQQQERVTFGYQRQGAKSPLKGPDAVAYRLVISACARGGKWQEGIRVLQELVEKYPQDADVVAYTAAITGCEYAGEWKHAFSLLDKMRKSNVQPNQVTMAAVIGACAVASMNLVKSNQEKLAKIPKQKALRLLHAMKNDDTVVDPNIVTYNAAIRACGEALDLDTALQLLDELEERQLEPTQVTFGSLMTACERVGNLDGASKVFKRMRQAGMEANEIIYGAAVSCCRKAGDPERALLLLRKMIRQELSPNVATFNTVLVAQTEGRKADLQRGLHVFKLMRSKQYSSARPNRQTYNILIKGLAANLEPVGAEAMIRKMQSDGFTPDVDLYTATVTAYEKTGQPLKALRLMESMERDGYDFYDIQVLDKAFKKAVKLVNVVGRGLANDEKEEESTTNSDSGVNLFDVDGRDGDDDAFVRGGAV